MLLLVLLESRPKAESLVNLALAILWFVVGMALLFWKPDLTIGATGIPLYWMALVFLIYNLVRWHFQQSAKRDAARPRNPSA